MPITKAEASRLARRTGMKQDDFSVQNDGVLTLLNNADTRACVFLLTDSPNLDAEGICSVYEIRPKGCQTYPYVLDTNDQAVLDEGCLHRTQFPPPPEGIGTVLLNLEERIVRSQEAFASEIEYPGNEHYMFVLADDSRNDVLGTATIRAQAGAAEAYYTYRQETLIHASQQLNVRREV